jgi:hypothetical protein
MNATEVTLGSVAGISDKHVFQFLEQIFLLLILSCYAEDFLNIVKSIFTFFLLFPEVLESFLKS